MQERYAKQLAHLLALAREPGWRAHALHRAKELDADRSGLWSGIAADLEKAMRSPKSVDAAQKSGD